MLHNAGRRLTVGAVVVASVALAACGSDSASDSSVVSTEVAAAPIDDAAAPTTSEAPSSSAAADDTDAADDMAAADDTAAPDDSAEVVDMNDTSACLTGTWDLLGDQIAGIFDQGMLATIPDLDVSVEGGGLLELRGDGTYSYTPDYTVVFTAGGETGTGTWSGTQQGSWSVEGTTLTTSPTSNDITGSATVFGSPIPLSQPVSWDGETEVVSCDPATFTISTQAPTGAIVQTLVFAG